MAKFNPDIAGRFWSKVNKNGPLTVPELGCCWVWTAQINNKGYGVFRISRPTRRSVFAHRYAWELENGPIPDGVNILHKCDYPPCVRHLFDGDFMLNMQDQARKFRTNTVRLTADQVYQIRDYLVTSGGRFPHTTLTKIAERLGVDISTVKNAARHRTFKLL